MLVCCNVAPDAIDDESAPPLTCVRSASGPPRRGVRIGYEALAWGRRSTKYGQAWEIVQAADHRHVGLMVDSFHTLSRSTTTRADREIPGEKLFFVQLADAPLHAMDPLSWSRHFRCFPGQGDVAGRRVSCATSLASGYSGPLSLEVFNDEFRAAPPRPTALDAMRSLLLLEEQLAPADAAPAARPARTRSPPPPVCHGVEFIEFAVDAETRPRLDRDVRRDGLCAGRHASLQGCDPVPAGRRQPDPQRREGLFAHSFFLIHGPSVCALAFRVGDARGAIERALRYKAQTFAARSGRTS